MVKVETETPALWRQPPENSYSLHPRLTHLSSTPSYIVVDHDRRELGHRFSLGGNPPRPSVSSSSSGTRDSGPAQAPRAGSAIPAGANRREGETARVDQAPRAGSAIPAGGCAVPSSCRSLTPTALALGSVARWPRPAVAGLDARAMQNEHPPPSPAWTRGTDYRRIVHPYRPIAAPGRFSARSLIQSRSSLRFGIYWECRGGFGRHEVCEPRWNTGAFARIPAPSAHR